MPSVADQIAECASRRALWEANDIPEVDELLREFLEDGEARLHDLENDESPGAENTEALGNPNGRHRDEQP